MKYIWLSSNVHLIITCMASGPNSVNLDGFANSL